MVSPVLHIIAINIIVIFQEIHLATGTISNIQSGSKRLLGKAYPIHALQVHGELIYAAGSSLDGTAIKVSHTLYVCVCVCVCVCVRM
jgi:hypothetical protein